MSDVLGYAAASTVLASFLMRSMVPLRLLAILSNVLFLSYGYLADIHPVLALHAALLPINIARLATQRSGDAFFDRTGTECLQQQPAECATSCGLVWDLRQVRWDTSGDQCRARLLPSMPTKLCLRVSNPRCCFQQELTHAHLFTRCSFCRRN
jgi:hypothetical protein